MSLRLRITLVALVAVLIPLGLLGWGAHSEMEKRLTEHYTANVRTFTSIIEQELRGEGEEIGVRLEALKGGLAADNSFRLALEGVPGLRGYLLDYAERSMNLMGLSMLQVQRGSGRILSSGHFRNQYDVVDSLPVKLSRMPLGTALVQVRSADGPFLVLARVDSLDLAGNRLTLVGGMAVGHRFLSQLASNREIDATLVFPDGVLSSDSTLTRAHELARVAGVPTRNLLSPNRYLVRRIEIPYIGAKAGRPGTAEILVSYSLAPLDAAQERIRLWLAGALVGITAGAVLFTVWLSHLLSRPIRQLAQKTAEIDLESLDGDFSSRRRDEVGTLSRFLASMTERLRVKVAQLRRAERQATLGEMARQVNHDIRNGLTPIRNVIRHLAEVSRDDPGSLRNVFEERKHTLESSVTYLERLAADYARLTPVAQRRECDLTGIARVVAAAGRGAPGVRVVMQAGTVPRVVGDPLSLRRILENLVWNGIESLDGRGEVTIETLQTADPGGRPLAQVTVSDTGRGMSEEDLARVFDDFYSTTGGAGLGLSIVRRLVADHAGTIDLVSVPGEGTRFVLRFPAAPRAEDLEGSPVGGAKQ